MDILTGDELGLLWFAVAIVGPVIWLALGLATYMVDRRSKNTSGGPDAAGTNAREVTRFALPARNAALIMACVPPLLPVIWALPLVARSEDVLVTASLYAWLVLTVAWGVGAVALTVLLGAGIVDMWRGRHVAGRDTKVAYIVVASLCLLVGGVIVSLAL